MSVLWERPDQEHDFGGTNRELRCRRHWGREAPRAPRPREPLPVDPGWKVVRPGRGGGSPGGARPSGGRSGLRTERFTPGPRPIDVPELNRMRTRANGFLARHPERTLEICERALGEERRLLAQVGRRIRVTMDDFRRLRAEALARRHGRPCR
ncbi:hypothetical protein A6A08_07410 [Nocardiopsis sp. TSRI0078]|uniref:hypothetical protein n=1 Tax=unclassified Nocardiopsis TaxID=2649073 RepID=UPI00093C0B8C|nr:hypothetical protein [Nocardiopsis sp. TSRI0078]OKI17077.1 hypothetical protein A6A08_07410 [Nocardiopsis sp. TSRI0078]